MNFTDLATALTALDLPRVWEATEAEGWRCTLKAGNLSIFLRLIQKRWNISGELGEAHECSSSEERKKIKITCASDRTPQAIAADIKRRIMPHYIPLHQEAWELYRKNEDRVKQRLDFAERLAQIAGGSTRAGAHSYQTRFSASLPPNPGNENRISIDGFVCGAHRTYIEGEVRFQHLTMPQMAYLIECFNSIAPQWQTKESRDA